MRTLLAFLFLSISTLSTAQEFYPSLHLSPANGLLQTSVTTIVEDPYGRIWIGGPQGLQVYNGKDLELVAALKGETILSLHLHGNLIYCLSLKGLIKIDPSNFTFLAQVSWESEFINPIYLDQSIVLVDPEGDTNQFDFDLIPMDRLPEGRIAFHPKFQMEEAEMELKDGKLYGEIDGEMESLIKFYCLSLCAYTPDRFLAGSHQGLLEITRKGKQWHIQKHLSQNRLDCVFVDSQKNIWIGTANNGLFMIHHQSLNVHYQPFIEDDGNPISFWTYIPIGEELYVASTIGLLNANHPGNGDSIEKAGKGIACWSGVAGHGQLLLGTNQGIISLTSGKEPKKVYFNEDVVLDNMIIQILKEENGFVGITKSGFVFLNKDGSFRSRKAYEDVPAKTYMMQLRSHKGGFWAASTKGVYYLDSTLKVVESLSNPKARVFYDTEHWKDSLLAASYDGGLFGQSGDSLKAIPFPEKSLIGLEVVEEKELWIQSFTGLYRKKEGKLQAFTPENGFPDIEYDQNGFFQSTNGRMYVSGTGGFFHFDPKQLDPESDMPRLLIKHDGVVLDSETAFSLAYDQSEIYLDLELPLFNPNGQYEIVYQEGEHQRPLKPFEKHLFKVDYGASQLTFKVRDTYSSADVETTISVNRAIPFWLSWWFRLLAIIGLLLLGIGIYLGWRFWQTRKLLRIEKGEKKVMEERMRISRELHDNIGARLTYIISSLDLEAHQNKKDQSLSSINAFVRETMKQLRETIWAVGNKAIFLSELVLRLEQFMAEANEMAAAEFTVEKSFKVDFPLDPVETINYYRVVQEALNNAIKYAKANKVQLSIKETTHSIVVEIKDDGVGFDLHNTVPVSGLINMRMRVEESGGQFELISNPGEGSCIRFSFSKREE